jgi:hydroxymethylpyrimidine pyrophosphatase-like HAD family hydrolase
VIPGRPVHRRAALSDVPSTSVLRSSLMRYLTLVADYDGTLATNDRISEETATALERLRASGRRAIMVTGRRLNDLLAVCTCPNLFDLIVAENGAVVYEPATRSESVLGNPPSKALLKALRARSVTPLEIGEVIVATFERHRAAVQDVVWELGLEAQVIGNRGAVMILPAGINKPSGLGYALRKLGLSRHEAVGIGDAENNDHGSFASGRAPFLGLTPAELAPVGARCETRRSVVGQSLSCVEP